MTYPDTNLIGVLGVACTIGLANSGKSQQFVDVTFAKSSFSPCVLDCDDTTPSTQVFCDELIDQTLSSTIRLNDSVFTSCADFLQIETAGSFSVRQVALTRATDL